MKRVLAVAAAPLFLLAACGGGDSSSSPSTVTKTVTASSDAAPPSSEAGEVVPQEQPNPVELMKKIPGCVIQDNAKMGSSDLGGNLYATCAHGGEADNAVSITMRTNTMTPEVIRTVQPNDTYQIAYGPTWLAEMTTGNAGQWSITAEEVGKLLGGQAVPPGGVDVSE